MYRIGMVAALALLLSGCAAKDPEFLEYWNRERGPAMRAFNAQNPTVTVVVRDRSLRAVPK